jgi:hypothetical protein
MFKAGLRPVETGTAKQLSGDLNGDNQPRPARERPSPAPAELIKDGQYSPSQDLPG